MTKYRLASVDFVFAPGFIAFAINGAKFEKDRKQMIDLVAKGWSIPHHAAEVLICESVPYEIVGETVVFTVETVQ